jgi:hypothetical protein
LVRADRADATITTLAGSAVAPVVDATCAKPHVQEAVAAITTGRARRARLPRGSIRAGTREDLDVRELEHRAVLEQSADVCVGLALGAYVETRDERTHGDAARGHPHNLADVLISRRGDGGSCLLVGLECSGRKASKHVDARSDHERTLIELAIAGNEHERGLLDACDLERPWQRRVGALGRSILFIRAC